MYYVLRLKYYSYVEQNYADSVKMENVHRTPLPLGSTNLNHFHFPANANKFPCQNSRCASAYYSQLFNGILGLKGVLFYTMKALIVRKCCAIIVRFAKNKMHRHVKENTN